MKTQTPIEIALSKAEMKPMTYADNEIDASSAIPHATHEGVFNLGGIKIKCYQLSDGQRVIAADDPFLIQLIEGLKDIQTPEAMEMYRRLTPP